MNPRTALATTLTLAAVLCAADTIVPQYGRESVHVASGSSVVSGAVAVSDDARLVKSGNGAATLDKESIVTPNAPDIDVLDGSLTIGSNGGTPVVPAEPTALLETAALWLAADADKANFTTRTSGNNTLVDVWRDVRDTDASATNYPYAATPSNFVSPILKTDSAGNRCLYFRGYRVQPYCAMHLYKTDGTSYKAAGQKVTSTTVFAVTRIANTWGNLLGNCAINTCYQISAAADANGAVPTAYYGTFRNPEMRSMRFFDNGESRDVLRDQIYRGLHLLEWCHSSEASGSFDALYEYGVQYGREGGDYLMELVVFDAALPEADRLAVEAYLAAKWGLSGPGAKLRVAAGTTATISTGDLVVGLSGEGAVEATASGNTFSASGDSPFGGSLKLADGVSATITGSGVPLSLEAGDSLDVSGETAALAKTAAADAVEKTGTGMARVTVLPTGVSKLAVKGGSLVLAAPVSDAMPDAGNNSIAGTIPYAGFETTEPRSKWSWSIAEWNGTTWPLAAGKNNSNYPTSFNAPEGSKVFVLSRNGNSAAGVPWAQVTSVTIPVTGRYELTFYGGGRQWDYGIGTYHVQFISGSITNTCDETDCFHVSTGFVLHRVLTPELAAGSWTMRISPNFDVGALWSAVDDFRMRLVTEDVSNDGACRLPNGGFEELERSTSGNVSTWINSANRLQTSLNQPTYTASNRVARWTFTQGGLGVSGIPSVGLVDDAMFTDLGNSNNLYGNPYLNRFGSRFLGFWSDGGTATSAAFSPPAGAWKVRFKSAFAGSRDGYNMWHSTSLPGLPQWRVTVSVNGEEAMTATSSECGFNKWAATVPDGSFTVADGDTVTVSIAQTVANAAGYIDEVELVPADGASALAAPTPDLPAELSVEVVSGATLDLDFPGTVKLRRLRLGSSLVGGIVSAATHPEYISGTGSLQVPPPETVIIMR